MNLILLLARDVFANFGWRVCILVGLMVVSGALEGLALTAALPLLSQLGDSESRPSHMTGGVFDALSSISEAMRLPEGSVGVGILMVALLGASAIAYLCMARLSAKLQVKYVFGWQMSLFSATLAARPVFLEARRVGDVVAAIVSDVNRVGGAFYQGCLVVAAFVNLLIYFGFALLVSPSTSLSVIALGGGIFLSTRPFLNRAFSYGKSITCAQSDIQSFATEAISAAKTLKANVAEEAAKTRFAEASGRFAEASFRNAFDVQKAKAAFDFGGTAGLAALLVAVPLVLDVDLASVLVVVALFVRLLPRIAALQQGLQSLNVLLPSLENLKRMRDQACRAAEPDDSRLLLGSIGGAPASISFRDVTVIRGEARALDGIDIEFPAGKIVAFVGPSGSGKSTLVDAILGFVPISSGRIEISGVPLEHVPLPAWRRSIGYVSQDTALFTGSVADNVRLGTNAGIAVVNAALKRAAAHFVRGLPSGVDTEVGDRGTRLSGGERQRLGLARALSAPRRVFILDEATSALDAETEAEVLRTVAHLAGEATVLIVAHRFSAVRCADVIHVLVNGRVVESGDWASLDRPGTKFFVLKQLQEMTKHQPEAGHLEH